MDKRIIESIESCVKCGICRSVCPVFKEEKTEPFVARGHISLLGELLKGNIDFSEKESKDYLYKCLLCTTCVEACPNDSPTDMIVELARSKVIEKHGLPLYKQIMAKVMKSRKLMDFSYKSAGYFSKFMFNPQEKASRPGATLKINTPYMDKNSLLPPIQKKQTFIEKYGSDRKAYVALFPGCLINYSYVEIGDALVNILNKLKIDFMVPKNQLCCGAPIYASGNLKDAEYLAKKNIEIFEKLDVEFILVLEPTCGSFMVHEYERLFIWLEDKKWEERAKNIAKKIIDPVKFLYKKTDLKDKLQKLDIKTTYHDPCHLKRTQKISSEPRFFIEKISNFTEMKDADRCCGNAGTFSVDYPELSQKIASHKVKNIIDSKAKYLVTGCSACMMQLSSALHSNKKDNIKTIHTLELIEKALGD
jgi:glycolate oxidase iron-sulfur subunit